MKTHAVFSKLGMELVSSNSLEVFKIREGFKILFLWGKDCPNCEVAKNILSEEADLLKRYKVEWFHCNVYEDFQVSTHFGLHGIPVFIFFKGARCLGKMTSFPGLDPLVAVLEKSIKSGNPSLA